MARRPQDASRRNSSKPPNCAPTCRVGFTDLALRTKLSSELRGVLDEATGKWGIRVNRVELKAIDPPGSIKDAMQKQLGAERDKRAAILTAEGSRQSQITTAEGAKQGAILTAEGERQAQILVAQGQAEAIGTVFEAIHPAAVATPGPTRSRVAAAG
jgi:regulator of protease activity HflC (stomatin/prohibitin superfamily)